jgi:hypothetical protein
MPGHCRGAKAGASERTTFDLRTQSRSRVRSIVSGWSSQLVRLCAEIYICRRGCDDAELRGVGTRRIGSGMARRPRPSPSRTASLAEACSSGLRRYGVTCRRYARRLHRPHRRRFRAAPRRAAACRAVPRLSLNDGPAVAPRRVLARGSTSVRVTTGQIWARCYSWRAAPRRRRRRRW